jgi:hypothetical protein
LAARSLTELAIFCACSGSGSVTVIAIILVSVALDADTLLTRLLKILRDTLDSVHWHLSLLMKDRIVIRVREEYQYLQKVVQKPISL